MSKELLGESVHNNGVFTFVREYYNGEVRPDEIGQGLRVTKETSGITGELETVVHRQSVKPVAIVSVEGIDKSK